MTIAAGSPDMPGTGQRFEVGRWTLSLALVLALHIVVAVHLISRPIGLEPAAAPPAAVMIDLPPPVPAPLPIPELAPPPPPEPPPPPQMVEPEPPPPIPDTPMPPPPPLPPPPQAVALPKPPPPRPRPPPKPRPVIEHPVQPLPPPPVVRPPQPAVAPAPAAPSAAVAASAKANWQAQLAAALARNKRYPRAAQEQRQQGTAALSFVVDRNGRVLGAHITRSSGFPLLDEEALALIQRAQPLPPAPPEVVGSQFPITVPISFTITR